MEAAGIEPASRDISAPASTRVVGLFHLVVGASDRQDVRQPAENRNLVPGVLGVTWNESDLSADFWTRPTRVRSRGYRVIRQPKPSYGWHLLFDRLFTWATDQPRRATGASTCPVEPSSPPIASSYCIIRPIKRESSALAFCNCTIPCPSVNGSEANFRSPCAPTITLRPAQQNMTGHGKK